jgi:biopolymer transport protein ExbB/TolQ
MNYAINSFVKWFKANALITIPLSVGLVLILGFFVWYKSAGILNALGNTWFAAKMSWQGRQLQKELDSAIEQKKEIDKTLLELAQSKQELTSVKAEKDRLEKVFNDQSKTAAEKVAEFRKAVADDPVHTPTDNVTTEDLCARAKAIGSSAATIAALCGQ